MLSTTCIPFLASNVSRRGAFQSPRHPFPSLKCELEGCFIHHPFPLPRFKCESEGVFWVLTNHVTTSLPIPLPRFKHELEGCLILHPPPTTCLKFPLPRLKCESEGGILLLLPSIPLFCFKCKLEGPFSTSSSTTCFPSLTSNASQRGHFEFWPTMSPPITLPHFKCESESGILILSPPFPLPRFKCKSEEWVFTHHPLPLSHFKCDWAGVWQ